MRLVLDTNVFVSEVFFTGPPREILRAWKDGRIRLVVSKEILEEYYRVAGTLSERHPGVELAPVLDLVTLNSEIVEAPPLPGPVCEDPDDDMFLACAIASGARLIVSGDKHLLRVTGHRGVIVLRPRAFVDENL
jgi:putative PIN family toxin of toxin-antitoxin system